MNIVEQSNSLELMITYIDDQGSEMDADLLLLTNGVPTIIVTIGYQFDESENDFVPIRTDISPDLIQQFPNIQTNIERIIDQFFNLFLQETANQNYQVFERIDNIVGVVYRTIIAEEIQGVEGIGEILEYSDSGVDTDSDLDELAQLGLPPEALDPNIISTVVNITAPAMYKHKIKLTPKQEQAIGSLFTLQPKQKRSKPKGGLTHAFDPVRMKFQPVSHGIVQRSTVDFLPPGTSLIQLPDGQTVIGKKEGLSFPSSSFVTPVRPTRATRATPSTSSSIPSDTFSPGSIHNLVYTATGSTPQGHATTRRRRGFGN